jgi:hypothetical protein
MPNLLIHTLHPSSKPSVAAAYDQSKGEFYIKFLPSKKNPSGQGYRYFGVPSHHIHDLAEVRRVKGLMDAGKKDGFKWTFKSEPGSEGSYLIHYITGKFTDPNKPYKFEPMSDEETAAIFGRAA